MKNLKTFNKYNKLNEDLDSNLCVSLNEEEFYDELDKYPNLNSLLNEEESKIIQDQILKVKEHYTENFSGEAQMDGDLPDTFDHTNLEKFDMSGFKSKVPELKVITIKLPDDFYLVGVIFASIFGEAFGLKVGLTDLYFKCDDLDGLEQLAECCIKNIDIK